MGKNKNSHYDNKVVLKPWGNEHVIYRNSNKLSVTFLNIDYKKSTSLHCHPKKKTGFVILSGNASVQLGLWKDNCKIYKAPSKLMIRNRLFHSIKSLSKKGICLLEIETPSDKKDLVRFKDSYGREKKPYESLKFTKEISKDDIVFKKTKTKTKVVQKYNFSNRVELSLETHKDFRKSGVGRAIIDKLFVLAKKKGCYKVALQCKKHNISFYKKCKYKVNAITMQRLI